MLADIQLLIAAIQAKDWLSVFTLAVKISNEIIAVLNQQGLQPHVLKMQSPATATTLEGCCTDLEAAISVGSPNWGAILAIVQAILRILVPLSPVVTP